MLATYGSLVFGLLFGSVIFFVCWLSMQKDAFCNKEGLSLGGYSVATIGLLASLALIFSLDFFQI